HEPTVLTAVGREPTHRSYCPVCETMTADPDRRADGPDHDFGTSGFVYRSNKLMYDHATLSLWSTMTGEPVLGQLVGRGVKLRLSPVVTTTWGEWRAAPPHTKGVGLAGRPRLRPPPPHEHSGGGARPGEHPPPHT